MRNEDSHFLSQVSDAFLPSERREKDRYLFPELARLSSELCKIDGFLPNHQNLTFFQIAKFKDQD